MVKFLQPQEVEVFYIIPAIRRELATSMKEMGYKQKEIAKKLFTTEPSISHYLKAKRATEVQFDKETKEMIRGSVKKIDDYKSLTEILQKILRKMNKAGTKCCICRKKISLEENCKVCFR